MAFNKINLTNICKRCGSASHLEFTMRKRTFKRANKSGKQYRIWLDRWYTSICNKCNKPTTYCEC